MDLFALLAVYVLLLLSIIFVLLFGENSAFQGTLVARAHELLSGGLCTSAARLCVRCCGPHAQRVLDALSSRCVERPNPALQARALTAKRSPSPLVSLLLCAVQLMYVSLVTGGYVAFVTSAWQLIPGPYVSEVHLVLGPLATSASLLFFILTCFSDPGVVTAANVERHLACYPFDGLLYSPKRCPTMRLSCPPRSKFCRVTNRRVARFDHYCGWMANDIGASKRQTLCACDSHTQPVQARTTTDTLSASWPHTWCSVPTARGSCVPFWRARCADARVNLITAA